MILGSEPEPEGTGCGDEIEGFVEGSGDVTPSSTSSHLRRWDQYSTSLPSSPLQSDPLPQRLRDWLRARRLCFTAPSWKHGLVLVMGAVLPPGKRTATACLRMTGRAEAGNVASYYQILNRVHWFDRNRVVRMFTEAIAALRFALWLGEIR